MNDGTEDIDVQWDDDTMVDVGRVTLRRRASMAAMGAAFMACDAMHVMGLAMRNVRHACRIVWRAARLLCLAGAWAAWAAVKR